MIIEKGKIEDAKSIAQFQVDMAMESEGYELSLDEVIRGVTMALEDESKATYLVAKTDEGKAIGSLMLTKEWSDWHAKWYLWIQSVYVAPEYRLQGVYRSLYAKVKEIAKAENYSQIRLYVDKDNLRGQTVYQHLGMHESHYLMYELTM